MVTGLALPLHADPGDQLPPLEGWHFLTGWTWDWWVVIPLVAAVGLYLWGVRRLAVNQIAWSKGRTTAWLIGNATIALATLSVLGTYDTVLFSVHMVQHMVLTMISPVLLAAGAPITLLLRNLGGTGRRRVVALLHSWPVKVMTFPVVGTALMVLNPYALYYSDLYPLSLDDDLVHNLVHLWFVITGCLYFWPLVGVDPLPIRVPYPLRVLLIMIPMPFHAFLGITIMGQPTLIAEDWYLAFNRAWPPSPLADQAVAGGIMWATGDLTMGVVMGIFFYQWFQASRREAEREDRRLDREERLAAAAAEGGDPPRAGEPSRYDADQLSAAVADATAEEEDAR